MVQSTGNYSNAQEPAQSTLVEALFNRISKSNISLHGLLYDIEQRLHQNYNLSKPESSASKVDELAPPDAFSAFSKEAAVLEHAVTRLEEAYNHLRQIM